MSTSLSLSTDNLPCLRVHYNSKNLYNYNYKKYFINEILTIQQRRNFSNFFSNQLQKNMKIVFNENSGDRKKINCKNKLMFKLH